MLRLRYLAILLAFCSCTQTNIGDQKIDSLLKKTNSIEADTTDSSKLEQLRKEEIRFLDDMVNHRNTVWVKKLSYKSDAQFNRYAVMIIENTTDDLVIGIRFTLEGFVEKGCLASYDIKEAVRLKPNKSITLSKILKEGECENFSISKVYYVIEDGTQKRGTN